MNQRESGNLSVDAISSAKTAHDALDQMLETVDTFETAVDELFTENERLKSLLDEAGVEY